MKHATATLDLRDGTLCIDRVEHYILTDSSNEARTKRAGA